MKKIIIAGIAALAVAVVPAGAAFAGTFGNLETINATGGVTGVDGLKIDYAAGAFQVLRNNQGQLYEADALPDPESQGNISTYWTLNVGGTPIGGDEWDTITSSSTTTDEGKSGQILSTLTADLDSVVFTLDLTMDYTYPNEYFTTTVKLNVPAGVTDAVKLYWNADSTLGGDDAGNQFTGFDADGNRLTGAVSPDGTSIEAVRTVPTMNSWAGYYGCPTDIDVTCEPGGTSNWITEGTNLPNTVQANAVDPVLPEDYTDNGFAVQPFSAAVVGDNTATFEFIFTGCDISSDPTECAGAAAAAPVVAPVVEAAPELASTGFDGATSGVLAGGAALVALLGALAIVTTRRRAVKA
jgi:hypothetical protein